MFADSGMSVFTLFNKTVKLRSQEKSGLEEPLCSRKFDTIFFMLGINELGYDYDSIVKQYKRTVEKVHELQPDAAIVLGANLHDSGESLRSSIYNNDRINALNRDIKSMAEASGCVYLDVNQVFDDENGNLAADIPPTGPMSWENIILCGWTDQETLAHTQAEAAYGEYFPLPSGMG